MGQVAFIFLALIFGYKIFISVGWKKLPWFLSGLLFFPSAILLSKSPLISFERFVLYSMLVAFFFGGNWQKKIKVFPLRNILLVLFLLLLGVGLFDIRVSLFQKIYIPVIYFLESFFVMVLTFSYVSSIKELLKVYRYLLWFFTLFGVYGILNYLLKSSPYHTIIYSIYGGVNFAEMNLQVGAGERFRISSFVWHAIYYGLLLSVYILIVTFLLSISDRLRILSKQKIILLLGLLLVNLILVNSRTPIAALAAGVVIYLAFSTTFASKVKLILSGALAIFILLNVVPGAFKIVEETANVFSAKGSNLSGSSVDMRQTQLLASIVIFNRSPITGNGYNYIQQDLGFSSDEDKRVSDSEFEGFESYGYRLLIEQGLFGIVGNLLLFISLIVFFIKAIKKVDWFGKKLSILSISLIVTFLLFIFGTGDMRSFPFFMSLIGINIKGVYLAIKDQREINFELLNRIV